MSTLRFTSAKVDLCIALGIIVIAVIIWVVFRWIRRRKMNNEYFQQKWTELQQLCRDKATWPQAITSADNLLEEALQKTRVKGKTVGERMVKAQRTFTDNDAVWFGHKLRNKIDSDPETKLKESDVKQALIGIRQALKDLGVLINTASKKEKEAKKDGK